MKKCVCKYIHIYMNSGSFCCIAEINTALEINSTSTNLKKTLRSYYAATLLKGLQVASTFLRVKARSLHWPLRPHMIFFVASLSTVPTPTPASSAPDTQVSLPPLSCEHSKHVPPQGLHYLCWEGYIYATQLSLFFFFFKFLLKYCLLNMTYLNYPI